MRSAYKVMAGMWNALRSTGPAGTLAITALALVILTLTGTACGGTSTAQPANIRVCQHYQAQRAWVKNLAEPSLADAIRFETWVASDAWQAIPGTPLARDLSAMSAAQQDANSPPGAVYAASARVVGDCAALGVTFGP